MADFHAGLLAVTIHFSIMEEVGGGMK